MSDSCSEVLFVGICTYVYVIHASSDMSIKKPSSIVRREKVIEMMLIIFSRMNFICPMLCVCVCVRFYCYS